MSEKVYLPITYDELLKKSEAFDELFNPDIDTEHHYKMRVELKKRIIEALFNWDVMKHDCKLTYKEWCYLNNMILSDEIQGGNNETK